MAVLVKSADYFTDYSEKVGKLFGVPQFIIGITIVSVGTSLPELITSLFALFNGHSEFIVGDVVGSNITNTLLCLGVAAVVASKMKIKWDMLHGDFPAIVGSLILLWFTIYDGVFTFFEAVILLVCFVVYLEYAYSRHSHKKTKSKEKFSIWIPIVIILATVGIFIGAKYTITATLELTSLLGFADSSIIALTAVALGTSLPELVVSVSAARRKNYEMLIGNITGSNIFNVLVVMGVPGLLGTLIIPASVLTFALPFLVATTAIFFVVMADKSINRTEGLLLLLLYALFIVKVLGIV